MGIGACRLALTQAPNHASNALRLERFVSGPFIRRFCQLLAPSSSGLTMANTSSAKKAVRKIAHRTDINRSRRSQMRTYVRKVEEAIASGDSTLALAALSAAEPLVMRAAQKGIVHKNTASRKVARLTKRVKSLAH